MADDPLRSRGAATSTEPLLDGEEQAVWHGAEPRISIVVYHRDGAEVAFLAPGSPLVVGRAPPSQLCISERSLSREHARFSLVDGRVVVEDLGSTNGTWIGGERIRTAVIQVGGEVMLGGVLARVQAFEPAGRPRPHGEPIIAGAAMRALLETVERVATSRIPVILHGETGTGKEVMARLVHEGGPRRSRRMVRVNCGAIPAQLVESTLFGHEKGAFTGAVQQQKGVFEEADKGTVFLDEIGELTASAQAALLRVLETGCFSRVGSTQEIAVDVRIIAATHRDLEGMVEAGDFRADLFYRLNTITLAIPPLRDRADEIEPLSLRFLRQANEANGRGVRGIAKDALELLRAYSWPGNVRELRNAIDRAVVIARGDMIEAADLPARVREPRISAAPPTAPMVPAGARERVSQYEAKILVEALEESRWSRAEAARKLGMPVRTLSHKMKLLGITGPAR